MPFVVAVLVHQLNMVGSGCDAGRRKGVELFAEVVVAGDFGAAGIGAVCPVIAVAALAVALKDRDSCSGGCGCLRDCRCGVFAACIDCNGQCGHVALGAAVFDQCGHPDGCTCRHGKCDGEHDRHGFELRAHTLFIFGHGTLADRVFLTVGEGICHVVRTSFLFVCKQYSRQSVTI